MNKYVSVALLLCSVGTTGMAQVKEQERPRAHIGFIYPVSTNGTKASEYTNTFSFHALGGVSKNEKGFALSGLGNVVVNDARGMQLAGLHNHIGNYTKGFALSGLSNYVGGSGHGFMLSGLLNAVKKDYKGFQLTGLINYAENFKGVQWSGLVNMAKKVEGVQISGLLNVADESKYPIGLINIIKHGKKTLGVSHNEIGSSLVSFRSGGKYTYGIFGVGYNWEAKKMVTESGIGIYGRISPAFSLNHEFKMENLVDAKFSFKAGYQLLPTVKVGKQLECFGGVGVQYMRVTDAQRYDLFPAHSLWNKVSADSRQQIFLGYTIGAQVVL